MIHQHYLHVYPYVSLAFLLVIILVINSDRDCYFKCFHDVICCLSFFVGSQSWQKSRDCSIFIILYIYMGLKWFQYLYIYICTFISQYLYHKISHGAGRLFFLTVYGLLCTYRFDEAWGFSEGKTMAVVDPCDRWDPFFCLARCGWILMFARISVRLFVSTDCLGLLPIKKQSCR